MTTHMNETELRTQIVEFLVENGETQARDVAIPQIHKKTINSNLIRMFESGVLSRRKVDNRFAYSVRDSEDFYVNNEPGYAYYLRNLPRSVNHESR